VDWSAVAGAAVGGAIAIGVPMVNHYLRNADRLADVREENAEEQMKAWARLHDEASRGSSQIHTSADVHLKYERLLSVFLQNMHLFPDDVRNELWPQFIQFGQLAAQGLAASHGQGQSAAQQQATVDKFNELYQLIYLRHLDAAGTYFEKRVATG